MKKLNALLIATLIILGSCSKRDDSFVNSDITINDNNKLLMLKVDYLTGAFEGGTELNFNSFLVTDTIPMEIVSTPAGDFGDISISHQPTQEQIFFGTVVWLGTGERSFPEQLMEASTFSSSQSEIAVPNPIDIKFIVSQPSTEEIISPGYIDAWAGIANLDKVQEYIDANAKVAVLQYTPSVGVGDPAEWDFYYMLYR